MLPRTVAVPSGCDDDYEEAVTLHSGWVGSLSVSGTKSRKRKQALGFKRPATNTQCPEHPRYQGKGPPHDCPACRRLYNSQSGKLGVMQHG